MFLYVYLFSWTALIYYRLTSYLLKNYTNNDERVHVYIITLLFNYLKISRYRVVTLLLLLLLLQPSSRRKIVSSCLVTIPGHGNLSERIVASCCPLFALLVIRAGSFIHHEGKVACIKYTERSWKFRRTRVIR